MIVEELIRFANKLSNGKKLEDIRIGLGMTAALLDDGSCGLSFTMNTEATAHCHVLDEAGNLAGSNACDITGWAMDINPIRASVGIAVMNALYSAGVPGSTNENAMDAIDIRSGDTLGMVGHFEPVLKKHGNRIGKAYVFDRIPDAKGVYPDWAEDIYLPRCDVVVITGTTLINKTIDHVLSLCNSAREIVVMGASTCLCPEVFRTHGVHMIAGTRVSDAKNALRAVSEGGGVPQLRSFTEYVCVRV